MASLENELGRSAKIDVSDQIAGPRLLDNETLLSVEAFSLQVPPRHLSALKAVEDLTDAPSAREIGMHGPSSAANVTEANKDVAALNLFTKTFFPRDAHIVASFLHDRFPLLTRATVLKTLAYTGIRENLRGPGLKDEQEFWKAPHEVRNAEDPIARQLTEEKDWGWPYYGAIDTTGKTIRAITRIVRDENDDSGAFLHETFIGLDGKEHSIEEALQGQLNWIRKRLDFNAEGILEALWINPKHHPNQTWADSATAFHQADGSWPEHHPERNWGVAPVELQAETYDALLDAKDLYEAKLSSQKATLSDAEKTFLEQETSDLTQRADRLKKAVLATFWIDDPQYYGGYFARATDRDSAGSLRPMAIRSSDMGHLLYSRLLDGEEEEVRSKREAVIRNLFSPQMLGVNGVRTLASDSLRYNEDAYHEGTSWPWVSYYIALGLERHGFYGLSYELKKRAFSLYEASKILPEYGTGSTNPENRLVQRKVTIFDFTAPEKVHGVSQPAQEIQAWTAAAILAMKFEQGDRLLHVDRAKPMSATEPVQTEFETSILTSLNW